MGDGGFGQSLAGVARAVVRLLTLRLRLAAVEIEADVQRVSQMLLFAAVAGLFALLTLVFGAVLILAFYWDTHRIAAAGGIVLALCVAFLIAFARFTKLKNTPSMLWATRRELERDLEALRGAPQ
jgi:uncharacterized membrane protein YqjE